MLEILEKLINEHGSSTILKERLELINDKYEILENKLANADKENELLKEQLATLKQKLTSQKKELEFIEYKGAKFKRMPSGAFEESPYCLKCDGGMFSLGGSLPFVCGSCGSTANFKGTQLKSVINEVKNEYA